MHIESDVVIETAGFALDANRMLRIDSVTQIFLHCREALRAGYQQYSTFVRFKESRASVSLVTLHEVGQHNFPRTHCWGSGNLGRCHVV